MRFALTTLLVMHCVTLACSLAVRSPSTIEGQPMPDRWIRYDLTPLNTTTTEVSLTPRTPASVCERIIQTTNACLKIASILVQAAKTIGASIKALSDDGSCSKSEGSLDGLSWVYYATGRNCDTTAEAATIQGAIKQHLQTTDGSVLCGMECLDLTHSGTWSGFLLIGPTSTFNSAAYCGPTLSFTSCSSGGNNNQTKEQLCNTLESLYLDNKYNVYGLI
ncbi:hypothetical protein SBOR_7522 [Sclerotinia borealis F-4128]|uniref:Secreted protein CSS2 C-terminal domain-containing protein n=1 Tax=Sclerotinia borealis (strain F-4128) TaxID=1432307 RepID=W9C5S1_SCLBF|nr:hypothetical protein SBOR_7522 [Sclerotinia borealis F-4128]